MNPFYRLICSLRDLPTQPITEGCSFFIPEWQQQAARERFVQRHNGHSLVANSATAILPSQFIIHSNWPLHVQIIRNDSGDGTIRHYGSFQNSSLCWNLVTDMSGMTHDMTWRVWRTVTMLDDGKLCSQCLFFLLSLPSDHWTMENEM